MFGAICAFNLAFNIDIGWRLKGTFGSHYLICIISFSLDRSPILALFFFASLFLRFGIFASKIELLFFRTIFWMYVFSRYILLYLVHIRRNRLSSILFSSIFNLDFIRILSIFVFLHILHIFIFITRISNILESIYSRALCPLRHLFNSLRSTKSRSNR